MNDTAPVPAKAPKADPAPAPAAPRSDDIIDRWMTEFFPESPGAEHPIQYLSGAWHHVHAATDELKRRLKETA